MWRQDMRTFRRLARRRGAGLVGAVAIMLIAATMTAVLASLLGVGARSSVDTLSSLRAYAIAQGGLNWQARILGQSANWSALSNQTDIPLGTGTFSVWLSNQSVPAEGGGATSVEVTVTGTVSAAQNNVTRTVSQRFLKVPAAATFALFWGRRTGSTASFSSVSVSGDYWSQGTTNIPSGSGVSNGTAYRPDTEDITGAGTYAESNVTYPYFGNLSGTNATYSMPPFDASAYLALMNSYNATIGSCISGATINQNANLVLNGTTVCCQTFNTNTVSGSSVTISGTGVIVANRDVTLCTAGGSGRRLTIMPVGGPIVILAGRSLSVNSSGGANQVAVAAGGYFYARSSTNTAQLLQVNNAQTAIDGALLLGYRRVAVGSGAVVTDSTLFVNRASSSTNNALTITGTATTVGTAAAPCSVISFGRADPALDILNTASVTGLVYQNEFSNSGTARLVGQTGANRISLRGSVIVNQFRSAAVSNANFVYDPASLPVPPPAGFPGSATPQAGTWDGN